MAKKQVTNVGEAIGVLIQVAELAQKSGILNFEDAVVTKGAIDFLVELNNPKPEVLETEELEITEEGPKGK
jgi:hypothetical protein